MGWLDAAARPRPGARQRRLCRCSPISVQIKVTLAESPGHTRLLPLHSGGLFPYPPEPTPWRNKHPRLASILTPMSPPRLLKGASAEHGAPRGPLPPPCWNPGSRARETCRATQQQSQCPDLGSTQESCGWGPLQEAGPPVHDLDSCLGRQPQLSCGNGEQGAAASLPPLLLAPTCPLRPQAHGFEHPHRMEMQ